MMTVAIVHYHLGPGGVSKVIAAASRALTESGARHVILVDSPPECSSDDLPIRIVAGLGYHDGRATSPADLSGEGSLPEELLTRLRASAIDALGAPPDIWHFHNHSLGKNSIIPGIVACLAASGERIVLQIHDLAEDGRPGNYQTIADCHSLYPVSPRIHYAFLNSRDRKSFTSLGLPREHSSILPNPISTETLSEQDPSPSPIVFAPIRGIRRKNLGELVFLSALARNGACFAVSRAPLNPAAVPIHDTWRKFARRQGLPIEFDVVNHFTPASGASSDFDSWLAHATHIITTSVSEGFGLPFLESIALKKPLIGRNLPHITAEHASHGIHAGDLYDRILIPLEWIDQTILQDHLNTTLERNYRAYRRPLSHKTSTDTLAVLIDDGWLDFGNLPEPLQQGVIELLGDPHNRKVPLILQDGRTQPVEDWLGTALANRTPTAEPDQLASYSPMEYEKSLGAMYSRLAEQPSAPTTYLSPTEVLTAYLRPQSFHFLLSALEPKPTPWSEFRAVVFDIYGTLLIAPAGGVKPDPDADPMLRKILETFGYKAPESPSTELHAAVLRHHTAAGVAFPEVDLRVLWREVLSLAPGTDTTPLVEAIESAWHPSHPMPGANDFIQSLARSGISLGLLSNAQCNTIPSLGEIRNLFAPELTLLSYHHGIAKPAAKLFETLRDRLAGRGISPAETLVIGNDPLHDIVPSAAAGFKTALFTGHPSSFRPGACSPDYELSTWPTPQDMRRKSPPMQSTTANNV